MISLLISSLVFFAVCNCEELFQCQFTDGLSYMLNQQTRDHTAFQSLVYGNRMPDLRFSSRSKMKEIYREIKKAQEEVLAAYNYVIDDLSPMKHFYDSYTSYGNISNFNGFYDEYIPEIGGSNRILIEVLNKCIEKVPVLFNVLAITSIEDQLFRSQNSKYEPTHMAGFMKFRIKLRGQQFDYGTIIIDPFLLVKPKVIMDMDAVADLEEPVSNPRDSYRFITSGLGHLAQRAHTQRYWSRNYFGYRTLRMYLTVRPYCSFLTTTIKPQLLYREKCIQYSNNGRFVSFCMDPKYPKKAVIEEFRIVESPNGGQVINNQHYDLPKDKIEEACFQGTGYAYDLIQQYLIQELGFTKDYFCELVRGIFEAYELSRNFIKDIDSKRKELKHYLPKESDINRRNDEIIEQTLYGP